MQCPTDVLVVDDEPEIVALIRDVLGDEGYGVRVAGSGMAALAAVEECIPALVLLDYTMPGIDGGTFLNLLRVRGFTDLPVVLMSAHARLSDTTTIAANEFLGKPFDIDALLACVGRYAKPY
jgi:CheY-like chemotaxis protein